MSKQTHVQATAYFDRIGRVSNHIHDNLDAPLDLDTLAEVAAMSRFHWHRVYRAMMGETAAQTVKRLRLARAASFVAVVIAILAGMNPPGFAADVVAFAFGLAAASFFPVILLGIFWKRMSREGAIAGMLTGLLSTLLYIFSYKGFLFIPGTELLANTPDNWFLGIAPEAFGALGALLNFIVAFVVSNMTAPVPDDIRQMVEDIRVPKGAGDAQDH